MTSSQRISIVSVGARTPVGLQAAQAAAAIRAGISRVAEHPFMVDSLGNAVRAAMDGLLDPKLFGWERMVPLATSALEEVLHQVGEDVLRAGDVTVALPETRPGFSERDASAVLSALAEVPAFQKLRLAIGGRGHAGALQSMGVLVNQIRSGSSDIGTVVGVDSYIEPDTLDWLQANRQMACEDVRSGMTPGEAAAAVVVMSEGARRRVGLPRLASIGGAHEAREAKTIKSDGDVLGEGLHAAVAGAAAHLRLPEDAIDMTWSDVNGERYRVDEWGFAVLRAGALLKTPDFQIPVTSIGDVGAAHGTLACVLAVRAWARQYAAGPRALVFGGSEAGLRAALVLHAPEAD